MLEFFTNPGFLALGAALVSVPIVIHLINRMRYKRLRWAAMEFLLKSQKRNRRRLLIEQLLLLALRCLLVALVGLLVSRFLGFSFAGFEAKDSVHIVLIDDTLSMRDRFTDNNVPRDTFSYAKKEVLFDKVVKNISQSSTRERLLILPASEVVLNKKATFKVYEKLSELAVQNEIEADLARLKPSQVHVPLDRALEEVRLRVEAAQKDNHRTTVHVIGDFRSVDWDLTSTKPAFKTLIDMAQGGVKIYLKDTAFPFRTTGQGGVPQSNDNVGIVDLVPGTRVAGRDMPVLFTVTAANFSPREASVNIAIVDDTSGQEMLQVDFSPPMPLKIAPGSTASAKFELRFSPQIKANETHFAQISAHLESAQRGPLENDGLAEDNVRHATVEVRDRVPVLVIDGEGSRGRAEGQDSYFIRKALISVPGASYELIYGDELGGGVAAKALERPDLAQYPTIFMLNVRELTPRQLTNLENYVREGGGVAFFMGPQVSPPYYNKNLYKNGKGLFPVPLRDTYYPPANEEGLKPEVTDDYHIRLRDDKYPNQEIEPIPIFGQVFLNPNQREFLKNLPIKRYFPVPRSEWTPEKGKVEELAALPSEQPITVYQRSTLAILQGLQKILEHPDYWEYVRALGRHQKTIETLVGPTSDQKPYVLARALDSMVKDRGKEEDSREYPNLTVFWSNSDPKIRTLVDDIDKLRTQVLYGDPLVVRGSFGKGKVVAVLTTAGKEWNDWGGGSLASAIYQPFIWELQNDLSSRGGEGNLTVGTPVDIMVDTELYQQKARVLKIVRYRQKVDKGKPAEAVRDGEVFGTGKDIQTFRFDKTTEPGTYISYLLPATSDDKSAALAVFSHTFNVDTARESRLQRIGAEELDKNLIKEAPKDAIKFEGALASGEDLINRQTDLSEAAWFLLLILCVLIAEQALAVHLSFHHKAGEGQLPDQVVRAGQQAA